MFDRVNQDAWKIRKLMREAEALNDEMLVALAALKSEMLKARRNPEVEVHTGQEAVLHLTEAEQMITRAGNQLFRTHRALSKVARETAGVDENVETKERRASRSTAAEPQMHSAAAHVNDANP